MKNNGVKSSTFRIAFCGVITALALVFMMITGLFSFGTFAFPCFAGMLLTAIVIEYGVKWALAVFVAVSILASFLAGDKEAVIYFIMLFGYYPVVKSLFERKIKNKAVQFVLKLLLFNAAAVSAFFIANFLLAIPAEEFTIFGFYVPWVLLIIGNFFFVVYDFAVTVMVGRYVYNLRKKIFK